MHFIDLQTQRVRIQKELDKRIQTVLEHGRFVLGPEVAELEKRLAQFAGVKHCVTTANGTDALYMALQALDIGPGDEVITSAFTFFATASTILKVGATPVFVDIDPVTYNIDTAQIEKAITSKTKALLPVDLYGQCADMTAIEKIAKKHQLKIICDGAQSYGATHHGKRVGSMGDITCVSFYPAKPLGCYGDGGACFTHDDQLAEKLKRLRNHGQTTTYNHQDLGINSRLDTLQAAILLAKLDIYDEEIILRQAKAKQLNEAFDNKDNLPVISKGNTSVYAIYTLRVKDRDQLRDELQLQGIPTAVHYPQAVYLQPCMKDFHHLRGSCPHAERASAEVLSIPFHPYLTDDDIEKITTAVNCFMREVARAA